MIDKGPMVEPRRWTLAQYADGQPFVYGPLLEYQEEVEVMPVPDEGRAVGRVRAEMRSLALTYGPNWERLNDTDADVVAFRLARAALEDG
jgi:hypothetical protein